MAVQFASRRAVRAGVIVLVTLAIGATLGFLPLSSYSFSPGDAIAVRGEIAVPGETNVSSQGSILMTDVLLMQLTPITWLIDQFNSSVSIYPADEVFGGSSPSTLVQLQLGQMADSKTAAVLAAYNFAHRAYTLTPGATVATVTSKADPRIKPGDLIVAVDGVTIKSVAGAVAAVRGARIKVGLTIVREGASVGKPVTVDLTATKYRLDGRMVLGIGLQQGYTVTLGVPVRISTGEIGGPSAGLAFTLGVLQAMGVIAVSHSARFAATGTIDFAGNVGDVGGVRQKAIAVARHGATLFLVPPPEAAAALSANERNLKIVSVSTLRGAVAYLVAHSLITLNLPK